MGEGRVIKDNRGIRMWVKWMVIKEYRGRER